VARPCADRHHQNDIGWDETAKCCTASDSNSAEQAFSAKCGAGDRRLENCLQARIQRTISTITPSAMMTGSELSRQELTLAGRKTNHIHYILGAPGSGKTVIIPYLRRLLPDWIVIDWDELMLPAERLAGFPIRDSEALWKPYEALMKSVTEMLAPNPVLLLGVCTPAQLAEWPISGWTVLDVDDGERAVRLRRRGEPSHAIHEANSDAAEYRALGLRTIDVTTLTLEDAANAIATNIRMAPPTLSRRS